MEDLLLMNDIMSAGEVPAFKYIAIDKEVNVLMNEVRTSIITTIFDKVTDVAEIALDSLAQLEAVFPETEVIYSGVLAREDAESELDRVFGIIGMELADGIPTDSTAVVYSVVYDYELEKVVFADIICIYEVSEFKKK